MTAPVRIGSYHIERLLGVGSFATVWLGYDAAMRAHVAIKVLAENWCHDLRVRERFLDEARILWRLDHPRLVRVHAFGELDDGRPYMVMGWADRGSLADRLAEGPIPAAAGVALLREIAAGVTVLHDHGIVHRDLTPANVLFRSAATDEDPEAEEVVIADLGLAKSLAAASGFTARAGTPGYMAPEQDDPLAVVDVRADVFSLGRLAAAILAPGAGRAGPPPSGVPALIRAATATRPADRYRDARAFQAALDRAMQAGWVRRHRGVLVTAAAAATLALGAVVAWPHPSTGAVVSDRTGTITVTPPPRWHVRGTGWAGQYGPTGALEPALVMAPDPDRWGTDPSMPGAFIGVSRTLGTYTTPDRYVAQHGHNRCTARPVRTTTQAGITWVVAEFVDCAGGKPAITEAAGLAGGPELVYVEIAPPEGTGPDYVDSLLAGLRIKPAATS